MTIMEIPQDCNYLIVDYFKDIIVLRKRNFDSITWQFWHSRDQQWAGGVMYRDMNTAMHPISEEEALLVILTNQWKGKKLN